MNVLTRLVGDTVGMISAEEALKELACNRLKLVADQYRQQDDVICFSKEFNNHKCSLKILDMGPAQSNSHAITVKILTVFRP